ncbi:MAG: hypothetical protein L6420_03490 [Elusimicrobia bacterium]|nr:hypothetical protein [Candidatus Omnitrophota bacterium]MCG2725316.1 hypothetical protein [Elusimicrobiota bacterium]
MAKKTLPEKYINSIIYIGLFLIFLFSFFQFNLFAIETVKLNIPKIKPRVLKPYSRIVFKPINEGSAFSASGMWKDVFWTINDSDGASAIYPLTKDGKIIKPKWHKKYEGIKILGAHNVDWEAICADDKGNLIIGDFGNNYNYRRDLALYWLSEPYPWDIVATGIIKKISFYYPDQKKFPPIKRNFDAEGMFYYKGKIYIFSKNRSDTMTKLYRLDSEFTDSKNPLTLIASFDAGAMVTDVAIDREKGKIALLNYKYIWVFDIPKDSDNFFKGKASFLPIKAGKCEGITFYKDSLLISNEQRDLFEVKLKDLILVKGNHSGAGNV